MDNQKDIKTNSNEPTELTSSKKTGSTMLSEKIDIFSFVHKKTEKLTTALYMVTNLLSDSEPMKWSLRKKSSELLSFIVGYKNISSPQYNDFVYQTKTTVTDIVSLLEVSSRSGLISPMNFSIIRQEFVSLVDILNESQTVHKDSSYNEIPKSFFDVSRAQNTDMNSDHNIKDKQNLLDTNVIKRTNRQNIILGLLKKKKELTIKDISYVIKDCSEKTIQREIISLIDMGILKKTGERRWSKYSLKQAEN